MEIGELYLKFNECKGISTDTRNISKDTMFFALKGENFNGNRFVETALTNGAKYCVVDEIEAITNENCLLVDDVLATLQDLATYHRRAIKIPIIGLTGSNGKTTTKELIHAVLSTSYKVKATQGNLNNHIGVPLTLLTFTENEDFGIVEMGANHQKEIEFLSNIAEPDFVLITNFGKAHLEGFGGVEGIIKGKSELYEYARANQKKIFLNADDKIQIRQSQNYSHVITFGSSTENDFTISFKDANPFVRLSFKDIICSTQLIGAYNFSNLAIAIAVGLYFKVAKELIKKGIESYSPTNNRSQIINTNSNRIILDAYNANPTSMRAALENFIQIDGNNKFLFLGDMFELGDSAEKEHQEIADFASKNFDANIYLIGENFYRTNTSSTIKAFRTYQEFEDHLKTLHIKNASLLIKGSRGMALERIIDLL